MNPTYWAIGILVTVFGISVSVTIAAITMAYKFGLWKGEVDNDRANFNDFMKEVRSDIKQLLTRLPEKPLSSSSPIRLTELGERISQSIDAKSWAEETAKKLKSDTEHSDPFEIQQKSFDEAKNFEPDEILLKKMRNSAFQEGIDIDDVKDVLGVELRDRLLSLHGIAKDSSINDHRNSISQPIGWLIDLSFGAHQSFSYKQFGETRESVPQILGAS